MDPITIASLIGSGLSFLGGFIGNASNSNIAKENLSYQRMANNQNIAFQREANQQNIQLVRDVNNQNIAFQQRENDITRAREDNAVQRAAADMTAAGLSKTLAAGSPASAQALSAPSAQAASVSPAHAQALNNQFKYESALQKMNIASVLQNMAIESKESQRKDDYNDAVIDQIKAQTAGQQLQNDTFMEQFKAEQALRSAQAFNFNQQAATNAALEKLYLTEGKYKAKSMQADIDYKVAQSLAAKANAAYTNKQRYALSFSIAKDLAQTYKLNKESEMLVQDIALAQLKVKGYEHDLAYAYKTGLPVGSMPNGIFGSALNTGTTLRNLVNTFKLRNAGFSPEVIEKLNNGGSGFNFAW